MFIITSLEHNERSNSCTTGESLEIPRPDQKGLTAVRRPDNSLNLAIIYVSFSTDLGMWSRKAASLTGRMQGPFYSRT